MLWDSHNYLFCWIKNQRPWRLTRYIGNVPVDVGEGRTALPALSQYETLHIGSGVSAWARGQGLRDSRILL